jgi:hypothetical protein
LSLRGRRFRGWPSGHSFIHLLRRNIYLINYFCFFPLAVTLYFISRRNRQERFLNLKYRNRCLL